MGIVMALALGATPGLATYIAWAMEVLLIIAVQISINKWRLK